MTHTKSAFQPFFLVHIKTLTLVEKQQGNLEKYKTWQNITYRLFTLYEINEIIE